MARHFDRPQRTWPGLKRQALLLVGLASAVFGAQADPGYYLVRPYAAAGKSSLDLRYWSVQAPGEAALLWPELGLRHGFSERWTSEILLSWIGPGWRSQKLSSLNWMNQWLLSSPDSDHELALHTQLIHNRGRHAGTALEIGPSWQGDWGLSRLNLNLLLEHDWARREGTQLKLQWQVSRPLQPGLRLGLQGFGELGRWNHWLPAARQSQRAGPMLHWVPEGQQGLSFNAAYLWGRTYGRRGDMFSAQLLLDF